MEGKNKKEYWIIKNKILDGEIMTIEVIGVFDDLEQTRISVNHLLENYKNNYEIVEVKRDI